jgi:membrane associated rhomboid family serine protease
LQFVFSLLYLLVVFSVSGFIGPMFVVIFSQAYRLLSTAFFHLSLMHIAFNCMTLHTVASPSARSF